LEQLKRGSNQKCPQKPIFDIYIYLYSYKKLRTVTQYNKHVGFSVCAFPLMLSPQPISCVSYFMISSGPFHPVRCFSSHGSYDQPCFQLRKSVFARSPFCNHQKERAKSTVLFWNRILLFFSYENEVFHGLPKIQSFITVLQVRVAISIHFLRYTHNVWTVYQCISFTVGCIIYYIPILYYIYIHIIPIIYLATYLPLYPIPLWFFTFQREYTPHGHANHSWLYIPLLLVDLPTLISLIHIYIYPYIISPLSRYPPVNVYTLL
jgi:hypothetical protein